MSVFITYVYKNIKNNLKIRCSRCKRLSVIIWGKTGNLKIVTLVVVVGIFEFIKSLKITLILTELTVLTATKVSSNDICIGTILGLWAKAKNVLL